LLRDALKPIAPIRPEKLTALLADLDSPQFSKREAASKAIAEISEQADPALREALRGSNSVEKRQRLEALLAAPYPPPSPSMLRGLRGIVALEIIASSEAKDLLRELAKGDSAARETRAAHAALFRMEHGPKN
jgi:hypothetical protein